jgi:SprT protein
LSLFYAHPVLDPPHPGFLKVLRLLEPYIPPAAAEGAALAVAGESVLLKISRGRATKSGDFRAGRNGQPDRISVNRTLTPPAFLITLLHEVAHARVHARHQHRSLVSGKRKKSYSPHGNEWKNEFRELLAPFLEPDIFPHEVLECLRAHLKNPRASTFSDLRLSRALAKLEPPSGLVYLESLPEGAQFEIPSGRKFIKGVKKRKRFLCVSLDNSRKYLVSPLAQVSVITP